MINLDARKCSRIRAIALLSMLVLLSPCAYLRSQAKKAMNSQGKSQPTFRLPVDVVVINATVTDRNGNPVTDLTQSDFKIYVDGKPREIQTFALESYEPVFSENPVRLKRDAGVSEKPAPNATRARMIAMFIDDATTSSMEYFPSVWKAMARFVEEDMGSATRIVEIPYDCWMGILKAATDRTDFTKSFVKSAQSATVQTDLEFVKN